MNRVGAMGRGESVWLGWFLYATLVAFAPLARARGQRTRETQSLTHAATLRSSLERESWDGEWYRRGYFNDWTPPRFGASKERTPGSSSPIGKFTFRPAGPSPAGPPAPAAGT